MELLALFAMVVFFVTVYIVVSAVWGGLRGVGWLIDRARWTIYSLATQQYEHARFRIASSQERDLIELPGPPCRARVRFYHHTLGDRRVGYTEFLAEPEWRDGALRVSTPDWRGALDQFYGGRDLLVGDTLFDHRFVVQANPESLARDLLDPPTRALLSRLAAVGDGPFLLQIRPRQLLVRVSRRFREGPILGDVIEQCYRLATRLEGMSASATVEAGDVRVGADATCQVCGAKIALEARVLCRTCRTPHHGDCWTYNDGCSIFACGERRSVRA